MEKVSYSLYLKSDDNEVDVEHLGFLQVPLLSQDMYMLKEKVVRHIKEAPLILLGRGAQNRYKMSKELVVGD